MLRTSVSIASRRSASASNSADARSSGRLALLRLPRMSTRCRPATTVNAWASLLRGVVSSLAFAGSKVARNLCMPGARIGSGIVRRFGPASRSTGVGCARAVLAKRQRRVVVIHANDTVYGLGGAQDGVEIDRLFDARRGWRRKPLEHNLVIVVVRKWDDVDWHAGRAELFGFDERVAVIFVAVR